MYMCVYAYDSYICVIFPLTSHTYNNIYVELYMLKKCFGVFRCCWCFIIVVKICRGHIQFAMKFVIPKKQRRRFYKVLVHTYTRINGHVTS